MIQIEVLASILRQRIGGIYVFLFFILCLVGLVVLPMMNAIRVYQQHLEYRKMGVTSSDLDEFQAQVLKYSNKVVFNHIDVTTFH